MNHYSLPIDAEIVVAACFDSDGPTTDGGPSFFCPNDGAVVTAESIELSPRSKDALELLALKLEAGELLGNLTTAAPFIQVLAGSPVDGLVSVSLTDWDAWARVVGEIPRAVRDEARRFCTLQAVSLGSLPQEDRRFWRALADSFR